VAADGSWTEAHARRLLWRAGFGPAPGEAERWASAGKRATLRWLLDGARGPELTGPEPRIDGRPLDPENEWGHDVLWWLDRMVRSQRPLVEKMTLFWHDHFATSGQETPLMLRQNHTFRRHALGSFRKLLRAVTADPAMQLFLSIADSHKDAPNENYAREVMELFALGRGYSERDIREASRALTGFASQWDDGFRGIRYVRANHDSRPKRIFGRRGRFDWRDVVDLVCDHRAHAPFMVEKLWSFFVTRPLDAATRRELVRVYRRSRLRVKPVVAAILRHPALYADLDRPDMVKCPAVFVAGNLRTIGAGVDRDSWAWLMEGMGQYLFEPPSVAGWEWGPAWLSTNSIRARFHAVNRLFHDHGPLEVPDNSTPTDLTPQQALDRARAAVGDPWTSPETDAALLRMGEALFSDVKPREQWKRVQRSDQRERAFRHLLLSGPDAQLH